MDISELYDQGEPESNICRESVGLHSEDVFENCDIDSGTSSDNVLRLRGGKGGFGSMLRAIGAQIEKTTNREACRDLSGRRLRDINEEKRLKNWIALQADREREAAERRQKRLERLCAEPKHDFKDQRYEDERAQLADNVSDAVDQGFKLSLASGSGVGLKRKQAASAVTSGSKNKKSCLWIDADEEDLSSSTDSDDDSTSAVIKSQPGDTRDEEVQVGTTVDSRDEGVQVGNPAPAETVTLASAHCGPGSSKQEPAFTT